MFTIIKTFILWSLPDFNVSYFLWVLNCHPSQKWNSIILSWDLDLGFGHKSILAKHKTVEDEVVSNQAQQEQMQMRRKWEITSSNWANNDWLWTKISTECLRIFGSRHQNGLRFWLRSWMFNHNHVSDSSVCQHVFSKVQNSIVGPVSYSPGKHPEKWDELTKYIRKTNLLLKASSTLWISAISASLSVCLPNYFVVNVSAISLLPRQTFRVYYVYCVVIHTKH